MRFRLGLLAAFLLSPTPLLGQAARIDVAVDTAVINVGDRITFTVSVDHPPGSVVAWPDSLNLEPFEILDARPLPTVSRGDLDRSAVALTLTAFELGELEIPSFQVQVVATDGKSTDLETNRFGIQVQSVGLDEGGDIRDIRGPLWIPVSVLRVSLLALALVLAAVLAWFLYRRFRPRRADPGKAEPSLPTRPPHELALEALARLEASTLLERGEVKEYHIQVSEILRSYVEGRFRVPALEMTTVDITKGLEERGLESAILSRFGDFLGQCDLVKFAKYRPGNENSRTVLSLGRRLVEETVPKPGPTLDRMEGP
jgi:hypothetical protein